MPLIGEIIQSVCTHEGPIDGFKESFDLHFQFKSHPFTIFVGGVAEFFLFFPEMAQSSLNFSMRRRFVDNVLSFFLARYFIFDIESVYFDVVSKAVSSVFEVVEMAHVLKILIYELYLFAFISEIEA